MVRKSVTLVMSLALLFSTSASAAVSAEEARQLGGPVLTAIGAEKSGNKEGTIPAAATQPFKLAGYDPKQPGYFPDPYADEKPLFTITAQNAEKYADKLDGMLQMFKIFPDFKMHIYQSRRTVAYPKYVSDNTLLNATDCKGSQNELVLEGCRGGLPFPIPKTGNQAMWNHLMAFEGAANKIDTQSWIVPALGRSTISNASTGFQVFPLYEQNRKSAAESKELYWKLRIDYTAPTRSVGEKLVLLDNLDSVNVGRRAYQYIPGQRRVKLAPNLAYDTPTPTAGGTSTMDDGKIFLGALDRFNYKLVGKKEKFIPYNSFKTNDQKICSVEKLLTKNYPNPDCMRFELHRVWVVEAKLKPEFRHIYKTRRFYWDEDTFGGISENFDAAGDLYRMGIATIIPRIDGGAYTVTNFYLGLQTGTYAATGLLNYPGGGVYATKAPDDVYFSPESLAGEGIR